MKKLTPAIEYNLISESFQLKGRFKSFFLRPVFMGLFFFSIFFSVILVTKLIAYAIGSTILFGFNIYDIIFSLIGFFIGFLTEFILQIRKVISR